MMDPDYDLFMTIMREGTLTAAGREMRLSPAMVSKRLRRLEDRLGSQLLYRTTRRVAPTSRGQALFADLQQVTTLLDRAEERVRASPDIATGPLRINAPTSFGRMHIAPYLQAFLDLHPGVEIRLDLSDDFVDLVEQAVDVAIRITAEPGSTLIAHRLTDSERVLCASPDYIARHGEPATIDELGGHRLLAASGQLPWRLTSPSGEVRVSGESHVRTNSSEVVRELVISGAGIALRSMWDVKDALTAGSLRQVLPRMRGSDDIAIHAVHLAQPTPNAAVDRFVAFLKDLYANRRPW